MEIYKMVKKFVDALLSGQPLAMFDDEKLVRWIILTNVQVYDNGMIRLTDEIEQNWIIGSGGDGFEFFTMDEFNDMCRKQADC